MQKLCSGGFEGAEYFLLSMQDHAPAFCDHSVQRQRVRGQKAKIGVKAGLQAAFGAQLQDGSGIGCDPFQGDFQRNPFSLNAFPDLFQKAGGFSDSEPLIVAVFIKDREASLAVG